MTDAEPATPPGERRIATDAEARALASTFRMRVLRVCIDEAHTNKEIAQALGRDPASTLHHVRTLVDHGFLAAQPVRRGTRGAREIPYLATGKSWRLHSAGQSHVLVDAFLEEVALVPNDDVETMRLGLRLSPADADGLMEEILQVLERYRRRPSGPGATPRSFFLALHPDPNRTATG